MEDTYLIIITDGKGCTFETMLTLTDPKLLNYTVVGQSAPTCSGEPNGFIIFKGVAL